MANALANDALLQQEIDQQVIQNPHLSFAQKKSLRKSILKASVANAPKNSSFQTVLSVSNTMVGSSLLVIPVLFQQSGIMSALIVALVFCLISCKTCQLQVVHNKPEELDLPQTIVRILGQKYNLIFNTPKIILPLLISYKTNKRLYKQPYYEYHHFILRGCSLFYFIMQYVILASLIIMQRIRDGLCSQNRFCVKQIIISMVRYLLYVFALPYYVVKESYSNYQASSIWCHINHRFDYLYCNQWQYEYARGSECQPIHFRCSNSKWSILSCFYGIVNQLQSKYSLKDRIDKSTIHSCIVPIMKNNLQQENNLRDIAISFGWTWILYALVGSFGAIAIQGKALNPSGDGSTVLDYLDQNIFSYGIQVLQLFQLTTVFPLLAFITRSQFFALIYKLEQPPQKWFVFYTSIVAFTTLLFQCLNISVSLILSLSGAVVGFFQIYLIPIQLHMTCLYAKKKVDDNRIGLINDSKEYLENPDESIFEELDFKCLDHLALKKRLNKQTRFFIYYIIMLIGAMMGFLNIIAPFFK